MLALQRFEALAPLMRVLTWLGSEEFFLLMLPIVYLAWNRHLGARLGLLVLGCDSLAFLSKLLFHQPRPYWTDNRVLALSTDTSYGLPSSHAMLAVAVWTFLLLATEEKKRRVFWLPILLLIVGISVSRVYLGVHYPTDILGGWILGGLFLFVFLKFLQPLDDWFSSHKASTQIGIALSFCLALFLVGVVVKLAVSGSSDPTSWAQFTQNEARSLSALAMRSGAIFGLVCGLVWMQKRAPFEPSVRVVNRIAAVLIAVLGLLALRVGLGAVFPSSPESVEHFFRALRYAIMTFWVAFLVPMLGLTLRLLQSENDDENFIRSG